MGKYEKLISEILKLNKSLRFDELAKVLRNMGYSPKAPKGGSSHVTFRKPGKFPITTPKDEPINKVYVELVRKAVLEFESEESGDE